MSETSASLLENLREHSDPQSWRRLVSLYWPFIYGWLRRHGLQHSDAEDIGQDVLQVLLRELPGFRYDRNRGSFRNWLRTMMANRVRAFCRKCRTHPRAAGQAECGMDLDQLADVRSPLSRLWDQEHDRYIAKRLLALVEVDFEPATWQAFCRVACDGVSAAEVAAELGMSVNAVFIAKSRVMRRLRDELHGLLE